MQPATAAAKAGLKGGTAQTTVAGEDYKMGGDIIVGADGKPVRTTEELRDVIAAHKPGDKLTPQDLPRLEEAHRHGDARTAALRPSAVVAVPESACLPWRRPTS